MFYYFIKQFEEPEIELFDRLDDLSVLDVILLMMIENIS